MLAQYAPYPTVWPYVVHVVALALAIVVVLAAPGGRATSATPRALLSIGLDRTNARRFMHSVLWMAPFVFQEPGQPALLLEAV